MRHMFKYIFLVIMSAGFISCSSDEDSIQKVDQKLKIYIKDKQGRDLLNTTDDNAVYARVLLIDLGANTTNQVLRGGSITRDSTNTYYIDYTAGGTRNLLSENGSTKQYETEVGVAFFKTTADVTPSVVDDLKLIYSMTPQVFKIQNIDFNNRTVFIKEDGKPNIVNIVK